MNELGKQTNSVFDVACLAVSNKDVFNLQAKEGSTSSIQGKNISNQNVTSNFIHSIRHE